jgi:hypothetical protein
MAEVPDHLVPTDGLTNSRIHFAGLDTDEMGPGVTLRFVIRDEQDDLVGEIKIPVEPAMEGTVDAMIAEGFGRLTDMLRQWLYEADEHRQMYGRRGAAADRIYRA